MDLDPATPSSLDVITAVRAGVATYTDASGVIQSSIANTVRVDQTQGAELTPTKFQHFINTDFNESYWSFYGSVTPVYNYDTAPNDEQEAVRIISPGGAWPQLQETVQNLTIGQQYTASFYVKSDGTSQIQQSIHFTGLSGGIGFTPTEEWQRVSVTSTATATSHTVVIFTNSSSAPASSYLIYGPQLEEGTTASSFVANTTGSPKFITGATYGPRVPMILVEPSATNLVEYSEEFSNSWWSKVDATMEVGHAAPDGTTNAYKLIEDTSDSAHRAYNADITALGTISVYVKQGDSNNRLFQIKRDGGSNSWSWFDLQAGTVEYQTQGVASIEDAGNGWKRCTFTPTNANSTFVFGMSDGGLDRSESYQGDGTSGVYIWGAQIEAGSVATSYIPTSGSTVTRAADDLAITGSAFSDFYNTSEGTIYVEHEPRVVSSSNALFTFSDGTTSNKILSLLHQDYSLYINTGSSVYYFSVNATPQDNTLNRLACSFKANKASASLNGSTGTPNTGVSMPTINQINLGARQDFSSKLNGHIKRVIYWPTHSDSL